MADKFIAPQKGHISVVFFTDKKTARISVVFPTEVCPPKLVYFRGFFSKLCHPEWPFLSVFFSAKVCRRSEA
jgi:hypothetical protein